MASRILSPPAVTVLQIDGRVGRGRDVGAVGPGQVGRHGHHLARLEFPSHRQVGVERLLPWLWSA